MLLQAASSSSQQAARRGLSFALSGLPGALSQLCSMSGGVYSDVRAASGAFKYLLAGEWKESSSGKTVPVINPCTQQAQYAVQGACGGPPASHHSGAAGLPGGRRRQIGRAHV